jgi:hypothetical protein
VVKNKLKTSVKKINPKPNVVPPIKKIRRHNKVQGVYPDTSARRCLGTKPGNPTE